MSEQVEPTREEEDASLERRQEEDAQRGPGHEDPEETIEPGKESSGPPVPDSTDPAP